MTADSEDVQFDGLVDFLKRNRGFDFSVYKRPSLVRRIKRRMQVIKLDEFADYMDYLEVHPEEFGNLFNSILINVTGFFRDPEAWQTLADDVIPQLIENKKADDPIRLWCAGVASGEEVYTLAILFAEALGREEFQRRVKIYATDVDEEALNEARQASYEEKQMEPVPERLREEYFEAVNGRYVFDKELRRTVIFGRHDLVQDAPISRVDLLSCRNTLMYFNAEAQARILVHFHFALNDDGVLFLGKSEMLLTHADMFMPLALKRRIFTKVARTGTRDNLLLMAHANNNEAANQLANNVRIREAAFDNSATPQVV